MKTNHLCLSALLLISVHVSQGGELEKAAVGGIKNLNLYAARMLKAKKYDEAVSAFTLLLEKEKSISARVNILTSSAKAKCQLEDFGGAVNDLRKALELKHPNARVHAADQMRIVQILSDIYAKKLNDFPKAFELVDNALNNKTLFNTPAQQKALQVRKEALFKSQTAALVRLKKFAEARALAQKNLEKLKSAAALHALTDVETSYCKYLMATKKYAEARVLAQKLLSVKGERIAFYWHTRAMLLRIRTAQKDFAGAAAELELLKKTPGGSRFNNIMEEVRFLLARQQSDAAIALLVKSAADPVFSAKERGKLWNSAAMNVLIKNMDVKKAENYYKKAKDLLGKNFRDLRLENLLRHYRNK